MQIPRMIVAAFTLFVMAALVPQAANAANCPPGYGGDKCEGCGPGFYSSIGAPSPGEPSGSFCSPTQPGMYTTKPANTYNDQIKCPVGQYGNKLRGATACRPCPQGSYTERDAAPTKDPYCKKAPAGYYAPTGWAEKKPIPCPAGTYQGSPGRGLCIDAPVGYYTKIASAATNVYACPKGTYADAVKSTACKPCPAGTYQGGTGQAACIDAPVGYYVKVATAATEVFKCPKGSYADAVKSTACKSCAPGITTAEGSTSKTACLYSSPADYYNHWGAKPAPGTKDNSPHKCKDGKNWKTSEQACK
jgi:hypothetical protein